MNRNNKGYNFLLNKSIDECNIDAIVALYYIIHDGHEININIHTSIDADYTIIQYELLKRNKPDIFLYLLKHGAMKYVPLNDLFDFIYICMMGHIDVKIFRDIIHTLCKKVNLYRSFMPFKNGKYSTLLHESIRHNTVYTKVLVAYMHNIMTVDDYGLVPYTEILSRNDIHVLLNLLETIPCNTINKFELCYKHYIHKHKDAQYLLLLNRVNIQRQWTMNGVVYTDDFPEVTRLCYDLELIKNNITYIPNVSSRNNFIIKNHITNIYAETCFLHRDSYYSVPYIRSLYHTIINHSVCQVKYYKNTLNVSDDVLQLIIYYLDPNLIELFTIIPFINKQFMVACFDRPIINFNRCPNSYTVNGLNKLLLYIENKKDNKLKNISTVILPLYRLYSVEGTMVLLKNHCENLTRLLLNMDCIDAHPLNNVVTNSLFNIAITATHSSLSTILSMSKLTYLHICFMLPGTVYKTVFNTYSHACKVDTSHKFTHASFSIKELTVTVAQSVQSFNINMENMLYLFPALTYLSLMSRDNNMSLINADMIPIIKRCCPNINSLNLYNIPYSKLEDILNAICLYIPDIMYLDVSGCISISNYSLLSLLTEFANLKWICLMGRSLLSELENIDTYITIHNINNIYISL